MPVLTVKVLVVERDPTYEFAAAPPPPRPPAIQQRTGSSSVSAINVEFAVRGRIHQNFRRFYGAMIQRCACWRAKALAIINPR